MATKLHEALVPEPPEDRHGQEDNARAPEPKPQAPVKDRHDEPELWRSLCAELFGTFVLTFVAAGGEVIGAVSHGQVSEAAKAVAPGLAIMALIYALGDTSGMHINPAVTLGFALRGAFPWRRAPGYWLVQITGAVLAALLLLGLFGPAKHVGATIPHQGVLIGLVMEFVLTCFLLTAILGTATRYSSVGPNAAIAVGGTIALCGLFAGPISGASMNPARSLGPAIVGGAMDTVWIYVVGPCAAGALMSALMNVLHTQRDPKEGEAAKGKDQSASK
ncbi:MAG TPA: aquaporin [Chthonomonadaceae bacterium]|nr:aquaporin [Chthonomonadaceae bacterium]